MHMVTTDDFVELLIRYAEIFGEEAPLMMLPADEEKAAALLRRAIETGDSGLIDRQIPPDAEV